MIKKLLSVVFFILVMLPINVLAQNGSISGKVTDASNDEELVGATVYIPELERGTSTNIDGEYHIENLPSGTYELSVTYVGYGSYNVNVSVANVNLVQNIQLTSDFADLDELVVVGFGTQIKQDLTGNIARISGESIEGVRVPSFESAIQGRAAGVHIASGSGKLGQGIKMRIRGSASVTAGNEPLYVIDGMPVTSQSQSGTNSITNPLADLNFNDVTSIDILKDASAAAIYGSRASNGVVLITTKRGEEGRTEFSYNTQAGFSTPTRTMDWLNAEQYTKLILEAADNTDEIIGGTGQRDYVESRFDALSNGTDWRNHEVDADWAGAAFKDAMTLYHEFSASGGNESTQFYASGSFDDQEGIVIGNDFQRLSTRLNLDHTATERISLGLNFNLARSELTRVSDDNGFATPLQLVAQMPISPITDPATGELNDNTLYYNGLLHDEHADFTQTAFRNFGNAYANINLTDNLAFRSEIGADLLNQNEDERYGLGTAGGMSGFNNGLGASRWVQVVNYTTNNFATYNQVFQNVHDFEMIGGTSFQYSTRNTAYVEGENFPVDDLRTIASAAEISDGNTTGSDFAFLSYFSRANYKFQDKYLLSASGRVDGSSRFGADERYGFFPAASAGWILSEEEFLRNNDILSFLKLRASFGLTGNAEINNFGSRGLFGVTSYAGSPAINPSQVANPGLKWERTAQVDVGMDFGFFGDRINGELDFYMKNTSDLLLNVNVPGTSGFTTYLDNIGDMENKGVELAINTNNLVGELMWSTNFNISANRNEVTNLNDQVITGQFENRAVEGEAIGVFYLREYAGVDPDNGDALYYLNEMDDDGNITSGDETTNDINAASRVVAGSPHPELIGGLSNNFSYKGFDLNLLFQFVYGNDVYRAAGRFQSSNGSFLDNQTVDQLDRWQGPGDVTDVPQARYRMGNGAGDSSRYLTDGSYLRLKHINFGYTLPAGLTNAISLQRARVFVSGVNLLTFTNYEGHDPEVATDFATGNLDLGNDYFTAPQARTLTLGVNIDF
ncbi:MAG: TonB-dependent receptor [Balneolales bacterium]